MTNFTIDGNDLSDLFCSEKTLIPEVWGDSKNVTEDLLNKAAVLLMPGSSCRLTSRHHLHLSFATSPGAKENGITRLQDALPPRG